MKVSNSTDILQHRALRLWDEEQLVLIMWPSAIHSVVSLLEALMIDHL